MPQTSDLEQHDPVTGVIGDAATVIDAGALLDADNDSVIDSVRRACLRDGFFFIKPGPQHQAAIERTLQMMQAFFSLADDDARKRDMLAGDSRRGWRPRYSEPAYQPDTIATLEAFDLGIEEIETRDSRWPQIEGFREAITTCWHEELQLADRTLEIIAAAAGIEHSYFRSRCQTRSLNSMRLLHYAAGGAVNDDRSVGISAHTDFECITLLYQSAPGLELRSVDGHWLESGASVGHIVVMLDDMLERWTNGFFKATGHRVRETGQQRFSIVLFVAADDNVTIGPLPEFVSDDRPAAYTPVSQRDHLRSQIERAVHNAQQVKR